MSRRHLGTSHRVECRPGAGRRHRALAQDYPWKPTKPITIIVPWGAGGATDQVTRLTAAVIEDELKQRVVVVNQPGASGAIGKKNAWEAPRDGYTWTAGAPKQLGTYKLLGQWDTWIDDWQLYNTVTNVPLVSVNPNSPYKTMADFIAAMKAGTVTIATAGAGSSGHAAAEALKAAVGGNYKHVTYDGGNPAVVATVAGEAQATTQLASEQAEMVRGKRLRPLAVLSDQALEIEGYGRIPPITDFITTKLPILSTTFGIFLPKQGTPPEVIETLNQIWANEDPEQRQAARPTRWRRARCSRRPMARRRVTRCGLRSRPTPGRSRPPGAPRSRPSRWAFRSPESAGGAQRCRPCGSRCACPESCHDHGPAAPRRPDLRRRADGAGAVGAGRILAHAAAGRTRRASDERTGPDAGADRPGAGRPGAGTAVAQPARASGDPRRTRTPQPPTTRSGGARCWRWCCAWSMRWGCSATCLSAGPPGCSCSPSSPAFPSSAAGPRAAWAAPR